MLEKTFLIDSREITFKFNENNHLMINISEYSNFARDTSLSAKKWLADNTKIIGIISNQFNIPEKFLYSVEQGSRDENEYWFNELLAVEYILNTKYKSLRCWFYKNALEMHALNNFNAVNLSRLDILEMALESEKNRSSLTEKK